MADMIQPDLRVIVDLGYDRSGYANVDTPVGLFPNVNPITVSAELAARTQQGWTAAMVDLGLLPNSDLPNAYPYLPDLPGLASGSSVTSAAALPNAETLGALFGDSSAPLNISALLADFNTYLPGATTALTALFGSSAASDVTSLLTADLLPNLTALFANPLDLLSF